MSLYGALFTGVSALNAQSQSMGMISNNIANVNTVGYKRNNASFSDLVTQEGRYTAYSPGGVRARTQATINQQGILQQSGSSTDAAISGDGFFVVQPGISGPQETMFTRAGSFSEDSKGLLRNAAGFYLMGWRLDSTGALPAGAQDISSLEPVDVAFLNGVTAPTTAGEVAMNLNSDWGVTGSVDFTREITVYDSLGTPQQIRLEFTKDGANNWTMRAETPAGTNVGDRPILFSGDGSIGRSGSINAAGTVATIDITAAEADFSGLAADGLESRINLTMNGRVFSLDVSGATDGTTLATAINTELTALGAPYSGYNAAWAGGVMTITAPAGNTLTAAKIMPGVNEDGQMTLKIDGTAGGSAGTGINWGNGSSLQNIDLDISSVTQFAADFSVSYVNQDGAELGLRTGVSIDRDGYVVASFSNGLTRNLYKLPIATFTNVNGLEERSGNVYIQTQDSGAYNLREAGGSGAGQIAAATLEASNVDLADEFSKMIVTQRAYSAGTKVITTSDQMLQELLGMR